MTANSRPTISELFDGLAAQVPAGVAQRRVVNLSLDSRTVKPGTLFFALPGQRDTGARFASDALARGAVAVVAEEPLPNLEAIQVPQARRALALAAAKLHGHPDRHLSLLGVTGTNGKTTVTLLLGAIFEAAAEAPGVIGTLGSRNGADWRSGTFTTPEAPELCALLAEMVAGGVRHCAMEVSSHALAQARVDGLSFAAAGFTHLTRDHLDFHGDLERYYAAKRRLFFELLSPGAVAVVNGDDLFGSRLAAELEAVGRTVVRFGRHFQAVDEAREVRILSETLSLRGTELQLKTPRGDLAIRSPLIGAHNAENLALAAGLALAVGFSGEAVERGLSALGVVPGRLERIQADAAKPGPLGFVDYAHTDDALRRVLSALRAVGATAPRKLVVVFGCGGDRDPGKRPLMGKAAGEGADLVIATSDNPRSEDPVAILAQVEPGLAQIGKRRLDEVSAQAGDAGYLIEPDRRAAIALAVNLARVDDVVLVAGKGHETYQLIGAQRLAFDDRVELRQALERRAA